MASADVLDSGLLKRKAEDVNGALLSLQDYQSDDEGVVKKKHRRKHKSSKDGEEGGKHRHKHKSKHRHHKKHRHEKSEKGVKSDGQDIVRSDPSMQTMVEEKEEGQISADENAEAAMSEPESGEIKQSYEAPVISAYKSEKQAFAPMKPQNGQIPLEDSNGYKTDIQRSKKGEKTGGINGWKEEETRTHKMEYKIACVPDAAREDERVSHKVDASDGKQRTRSPEGRRERRVRSRSPDSRGVGERRGRTRSPESSRHAVKKGRSRSPEARRGAVGDKRARSRSLERERDRVREKERRRHEDERQTTIQKSRSPTDRDSYRKRSPERRRRSRSRSPEKRRRSRSRDRREEQRKDSSRRENGRQDERVHDRVSSRPSSSRPDRERRSDDRAQRSTEVEEKQQGRRLSREEDDDTDVGALFQFGNEEEDDAERVREASRRRRQAILEKYKQTNEVAGAGAAPGGTSEADHATDIFPDAADGAAEGRPVPISPAMEGQEVDDIIDNFGPENFVQLARQGRPDDNNVTGVDAAGSSQAIETACEGEEDDMFGESPAGGRRKGKGDGVAVRATSNLNDNWDDPEGYYHYQPGETIDERYEVMDRHGKGVFSTVVRARDLKAGRKDPPEVAIKIIRNNETMYKAGQMELAVLRKLSGADPENRRHCVRLLSSFEYRHHLCIVFESLHMNLREVLKKFGRNIGINLNAVRAYATQLFIALKHLRNCGVLHADIKPDNMLVNESKNTLKLADFGSAMFAGAGNEITPYLVSRFYRAPEITIGLPYDHALDMWSVGCCLYELYTGKILFPGNTNNDMLRMYMELKGPFPKKMLKRAQFADQHFDQDYNFMAMESDPVTKKPVRRVISTMKPKDMGVLIASSGMVEENKPLLASFKDLLDKIFVLDPEKRLTVSQALNHPFISGK